MKSRWLLAGLVLAGSGGVGAAMTELGATPIAIERAMSRAPVARAQEPGELCSGGMDGLARIEIVPDAVVEQGGRERVEYHSEIIIERGDTVGVAWQADVVDDRGAQVIAQLDAGSFTGRAGNTALTRPLVANLADGFYAMRIRVAVTADEEATVLEAVQHVEIDRGRWIELTDEEWFVRSRATEAFTAAELTTRGL
jgi:hypothetical protein